MSSTHFKVQTLASPCQHVREYPGATRDGNDHGLHLSVKKYTPLYKPSSERKPFTVLAAGGNGFPKVATASSEYMPTWIDKSSPAIGAI